MGAMDSAGIVISTIIASLMLFLIAETIYFIFFCKNREENPSAEKGSHPGALRTDHGNREFLSFLCGKRKRYHHNLASTVVIEEDISMGEGTTVAMAVGNLQASPFQSEQASKLFPWQGEGATGDILQLQGLYGPPRLLFTIKEEAMEEEDPLSEDGRSRTRRSCRPSRASSEFFHFETPPSSPPFVSPHHSPVTSKFQPFTEISSCVLLTKPVNPFMDDSSSSLSSTSSSGAFTPPSPRKTLSILLEETSSSSTSTSSSVTPFAMSPPRAVRSPSRLGRPAGEFFETSSSSPGLQPYRVYPLGPSVGHHQSLHDSHLLRNTQMHMEGIPIIVSSPFSRKVDGVESSPPVSPSWQSLPRGFAALSPSWSHSTQATLPCPAWSPPSRASVSSPFRPTELVVLSPEKKAVNLQIEQEHCSTDSSSFEWSSLEI